MILASVLLFHLNALHVLKIKTLGECDTPEILCKSQDPFQQAPREELCALERQDEIDKLVLIRLVDDKPYQKEDTCVDPLVRHNREECDKDKDRISKALPHAFVIRKDMISEKGAYAIRTASIINRLLISLCIAIYHHLHLPDDFLPNIRPERIYGTPDAFPDKSRHVGVIDLVFDGTGSLVNKPLSTILELALCPKLHQVHERSTPLIEFDREHVGHDRARIDSILDNILGGGQELLPRCKDSHRLRLADQHFARIDSTRDGIRCRSEDLLSCCNLSMQDLHRLRLAHLCTMTAFACRGQARRSPWGGHSIVATSQHRPIS
mmetsp:Transcript_59928/g.135519  ORF Transcript_59928/g.135519 Transcript_59928/m.135519 type:complete len:322 (+) Transcript_59928:629-1594(+)